MPGLKNIINNSSVGAKDIMNIILAEKVNELFDEALDSNSSDFLAS